MTRDATIIELAQWLATPAGRYLLAWEQAQIDRAVTDVFGFHALQLGLPQQDALRANRMPHRWVAHDSLWVPDALEAPALEPGLTTLAPQPQRVALYCDFDALPLASQSVDLVVLPHALELARDPHLTLREVERVLRPEGRLVITGFNPASLWGLRHRLGRWRRRLRPGAGPAFVPADGDFIGYWRLRDWLRLLSLEVHQGRFGCWRPPFDSQRWLQRMGWLERAGEHWWPVFGAAYLLVAVKRVRGMRLVGMARREGRAPKAAPAVAAHRQHKQ
jgi:SAM-dependent methyltransferase